MEDFYNKYFSGMKCIKTFLAGEAFGEIALVSNSTRTGTLMCREDSFCN